MNRDEQLARLKPWAEKAKGFSGWDLRCIEPKLLEPRPSWNYEVLVREYAVGKKRALDLGTGGGEFLSKVRRALPSRTIATEDWKVNASIAKHLKPEGLTLTDGRFLIIAQKQRESKRSHSAQ